MRCRQIGGTGRANPTYASLRRETLGFGGCAAQSGQPCTFSRGGTMCRGGLGSTALSHPAARSSHTLRLVSRVEGRDASASLRFDPRNKCEGGQAHHWEGVCHWVERVGWGSPAKPVEGAGTQVSAAGIRIALHDVRWRKKTRAARCALMCVPGDEKCGGPGAAAQHRSRERQSGYLAWLAARPAERQRGARMQRSRGRSGLFGRCADLASVEEARTRPSRAFTRSATGT